MTLPRKEIRHGLRASMQCKRTQSKSSNRSKVTSVVHVAAEADRLTVHNTSANPEVADWQELFRPASGVFCSPLSLQSVWHARLLRQPSSPGFGILFVQRLPPCIRHHTHARNSVNTQLLQWKKFLQIETGITAREANSRCCLIDAHERYFCW